MTTYDIAVIGGDGIGPEVTREAMKVVDAAAEIYGFQLKRNEYPFGSQHYLDTGDIFPDAAFACLAKFLEMCQMHRMFAVFGHSSIQAR